MKKLIAALAMVAVSATVVFAGWSEDFKKTYKAENIQVAVEGALEKGAAPEKIVGEGVAIEGLNPQNLVKALYCAGVSGIDVRAAAEKYKISEMIVAAGHRQSVAECGVQAVDAQAYKGKGQNQNRFFHTPSNGGGGGQGPASPATPE